MSSPYGHDPHAQGGAPEGQPTWGTPQAQPYQQPGYQQPGGYQPQYQQPGGYQQPGYGVPGYGVPGYGVPGYGVPGYGVPGYPAAPPYAGPTPAGQMAFPDAVRSVLTQYATFTGRARRSEYWWFALAYAVTYFVAAFIDMVLGTTLFTVVVALGLLVPSLAVAVRRLHDIGKSGWWLLIGLVPLVGSIVVLVFACQDSQPGTNQYGPSPKYGA
jgi:uncharacterized membrane protein YhaH (DUF805 family)